MRVRRDRASVREAVCGDQSRDRRRDAVRGVGRLRRGLQPQQTRQHELHLLLRRRARADDRLLDLGRRKLVDLETGAAPGEQHDAARVSEHDGRSHVLRVEHVFHAQRVRLVPLDQLDDAFVDVAQPARELVARVRSDDTTFDKGDGTHVGAVSLHDTVAGVRRARIDPEDDHRAESRLTRVTRCSAPSRSRPCRSWPRPSARRRALRSSRAA